MGPSREDSGCRNGVAYRASFLRNNDPRRVDDSVGFNAQRAIHIWDMKGRRWRAPFGRLLCGTGALASRALQSLAAGVAICRRVCSITGARSLDCLPSSFPITHSPFSVFARGFLPGSLLAFAFRGAWRAASKKFPAQPAGWLLGRRNLEPFALGMAGSGRGRLPCFA